MSEDLEMRFLRLLRTHGPALRRLANVYEREPGRRQDLEQDIALALWQALPAYAGACSERTFVFRVAHNRAISHVRRWTLRRAEPLPSDLEAPAPVPDPEKAAEHVQRSRALADAVRDLPVGQREVIILLLEGCSQREVAEILGISEGNVAVRSTRARQSLALALGKKGFR